MGTDDDYQQMNPGGRVLATLGLSTTVLVALALLSTQLDLSATATALLVTATTASCAGLLLGLLIVTRRSAYARQLGTARIHILLHLIPPACLIAYQHGAESAAVRTAVTLLLSAFFISGRATWHSLGELFPHTRLYKFFYRGNTTILAMLLLLYAVNLGAPEMLPFRLIENVAISYFSIHFLILGAACLKINADLASTGQTESPD